MRNVGFFGLLSFFCRVILSMKGGANVLKMEETFEQFNGIANSGTIELPEETLEAMRDCISDSTGLQPFMREQIEQSDELSEQVDMLQNSLQEQINELKQIADAAEARAKLAKEEAKSAKIEATRSRKQSQISNLIAIVAIVIAALAWLVPRDVMIQFFSSFIS